MIVVLKFILVNIFYIPYYDQINLRISKKKKYLISYCKTKS